MENVLSIDATKLFLNYHDRTFLMILTKVITTENYNSYFNYATFYGCLAHGKIIFLTRQNFIIAKIFAPCKLLEEFDKTFLMNGFKCIHFLYIYIYILNIGFIYLFS